MLTDGYICKKNSKLTCWLPAPLRTLFNRCYTNLKFMYSFIRPFVRPTVRPSINPSIHSKCEYTVTGLKASETRKKFEYATECNSLAL